jgi:hypothetical protein
MKESFNFLKQRMFLEIKLTPGYMVKQMAVHNGREVT